MITAFSGRVYLSRRGWAELVHAGRGLQFRAVNLIGGRLGDLFDSLRLPASGLVPTSGGRGQSGCAPQRVPFENFAPISVVVASRVTAEPSAGVNRA